MVKILEKLSSDDKNSLKNYESYLKKKLIKLEVEECSREEDMVIKNDFDKSFEVENKLRKVPE